MLHSLHYFSIIMVSQKSSRKSRLFFIYTSTAAALILVLGVLWQTAGMLPHSKTIRQFFLAENNLLEMIALSFLSAALFLTLYALAAAKKQSRYTPYWWLFPLGIFLLICDETSFGRVYYDWYAPINICGGKFDALHDMLIVIPYCLPQWGISKLAFCLAVFLILIIVLVISARFFLRHQAELLLSFKTHSVWLYLALAFILFWIGGGLEVITEIDSFKIGKNSFLIFLEETFEMLAEYTILFAALAFLSERKR